MKSALTLLIVTFFLKFAFAQNPVTRCATEVLPQQFEVLLEQWKNKNTEKLGGGTVQSVFNIPVIVHIIHNNEPVNTVNATTGGNLNAAQILDQINILNKDFNGLNADTNLIPNVFKPLHGKFQINFCLAVVNPTGGILAEPGIDRINRNTSGWTAPPYSTTYVTNTIKPASIWDPNRYFNIWVCAMSGGILGYATFPNPGSSGLQGLSAPFGTTTTDGVVILNTAFGSIGTAVTNAPYHKGRTATHEVGHWIGLRHIWGDGTCASDFCNDTPPAQQANYNCPTFPYKTGVCTGNTTGEMTMNFMDYTNDPIKYMFTTDQQSRIATAMANSPYRKFLGTHNLCSVNALAANAKFTTSLQACAGSTIWLQNQSHGIPVPQFTWAASGNATFIPNANAPYYVTFSNSGIQTISLSAANGTLSSFTRTLNILPRPSLTITASSSSVCANDTIYLLADGALSYTWMPVLELSNVLTVPMPQSQTITLIGMGTGSCISQDSIALYVVDCTGITSGLSSQFSIYPNPANSYVYIQGIETLDQSGIVSIWDYNGKIRKQQVVPLTGRITLEDLPKGLYLIEYQNARLCIRKKLSIN